MMTVPRALSRRIVRDVKWCYSKHTVINIDWHDAGGGEDGHDQVRHMILKKIPWLNTATRRFTARAGHAAVTVERRILFFGRDRDALLRLCWRPAGWG